MINVAIIGAGIGAQHLAGYRQLPDRFSVKTICDLDENRAREVLGPDSGIAIENDFDVVLANKQIDLIDICLPPHLHFSKSMAALEAGKHVVCEKPLVSSLKDADALMAKAAQTKRVFNPVFQYRYGLATAQLRALMDAGLTGKPLVASIETHWNRQADYYAVPWRGTWKGEQGGAVLGHAIHNHDLLCAFFGPVRCLSAFAATRVNDIEVEDCAAISFMMESGAVASSSITLGASSDETRIRFIFENLTAESGTSPYAPAEDTWKFSARGSTTAEKIDACLAQVSAPHAGFAGFFNALADAIDGNGGQEITLQDGRRSLEIVSAIYHSVRSGTVVQLPLASGHELYEGWSLDT
jgi:predicted dehydrogenase